MPNSDVLQDFESIKTRLAEIVEAVSDDNMPLDDALDLYEEAVALGMRVSEVLEDGINVDPDELAADSQAPVEASSSSPSPGGAPVDPTITSAPDDSSAAPASSAE